MSASESLKALDDLATYSGDAMERSKESAIRGRRLLDALPALIAAIATLEEIANRTYPATYIGRRDDGTEMYGGSDDASRAARAAIAALETALEGER